MSLNKTIFIFKIIYFILLAIFYFAVLVFAGYYFFSITDNFSYRVVIVFLMLIFLSNLYTKISLKIIHLYEKNNNIF